MCIRDSNLSSSELTEGLNDTETLILKELKRQRMTLTAEDIKQRIIEEPECLPSFKRIFQDSSLAAAFLECVEGKRFKDSITLINVKGVSPLVIQDDALCGCFLRVGLDFSNNILRMMSRGSNIFKRLDSYTWDVKLKPTDILLYHPEHTNSVYKVSNLTPSNP
eukprot:TRINITY_DN28731_c0_g1_i2.p1 TRINITY_DN28731_c0_g1~~TRINITY_DN28731_c0_g1_i2.p1  ORF type:complete len:186 (+),score=34.70 TRINITY_DN28731_c0_g1_i2:68-559(+)